MNLLAIADLLDVSPTIVAPLLAFLLFMGMGLLLELGRIAGRRARSLDDAANENGITAVDGAIFSLLGLLIAFTFSGAAQRFEYRRELIVQETNAIGTAWLRLDLLPDPSRQSLRDEFRSYLDARLDIYRSLPDLDASANALARSQDLQSKIWSQATAACRASDSPLLTMMLLPALNEMFDVATSRWAVVQSHPPAVIFAMLAILTLVSAGLIGYRLSGKRHDAAHMIAFAATLALTSYVILDIEYPRYGLIRVEAYDRALTELRSSMD